MNNKCPICVVDYEISVKYTRNMIHPNYFKSVQSTVSKGVECNEITQNMMKRSGMIGCVCNICFNKFCIDCYVNIFRVNKGIIKCPFCRYTFGDVCAENKIDKTIHEIRTLFIEHVHQRLGLNGVSQSDPS